MNLADLQVMARDGTVIASVSGEIDMSNARALGDELLAATANDTVGVVLDMSGLAYLDSTGIHLIYRLRESLHARGQKLRLVIPGDSLVADALRLAGVNESTEADEDLDQALRAIQMSES